MLDESMDTVAVDTAQVADGQEQQARPTVPQQQPQQKTPKPLRFVTNYGAPHPKRRRIGAACLTCRKRKTACSGERPACDTCKQNKLECAGYASESNQSSSKRTASDASTKQPPKFNDSDQQSKKNGSQRRSKQEPGTGSTSNANGGLPQPGTQPWSTSYAENASSPKHTGGVAGSMQQSTEAEIGQDSLFSGPRNRMPYFRWLGPTAIMPGFKQMVVKVKRQDQDVAVSSTDGGPAAGSNLFSSPSINGGLNAPSTTDQRNLLGPPSTNTGGESDGRSSLTLPFYDTSSMPPSELITHLANTFFTHLGCNYPFLQRDRFLRDLEEKQVDAILVDGVCALAARFSKHHLLTQQTNDENKITPAEYGHAFAQRATTALVDTFACPSVAAVQAALLLAYNEFGESRDSGLWMYLGISIRMAQDLGMHKLEGLKYKGTSGPTPKMIKRESVSGSPALSKKLVGRDEKRKASEAKNQEETPRAKVDDENAEGPADASDQADEQKVIDEQKAVEQERVDTFWAVFFLDRVVSSGTGRRSTLRDKDIEISFPPLDETDPKSGWPSVFPALIRIVHLYGRVADLLNSIKEPSDITTDTPKRLAGMESQVTNFYQGLSSRLHFDAVNFQHHMKAGEGTNFVLLHFWFHLLIVLLHQPTLLKTFEGRMLQLFPNSQQLSMSSAKTIADILSYSQLMDAKASLGNPFTTQPIYIAACAFLKETAEQTATSNAQSRTGSPNRKEKGNTGTCSNSNETTPPGKRMSISELSNQASTPHSATPTDLRNRPASHNAEHPKSSDKTEGSSLSAARTASALAKHTLLATAATQHYQLCYKALQSLETYWAGTKYILTVLDQKFEGVGDPLLYTAEEGESAMERPRPEPAFTSPGWRRKLSWGPYLYNPNVGMQDTWMEKAGFLPGSPGDLSKAIGWTMTGQMNSPSTNLAWHYPSGAGVGGSASQQQQASSQAPDLPTTDFHPSAPGIQFPHHMRNTSSSTQQPPSMTSYPANGSAISNQDASDILMSMNSPFQNTTPNTSVTAPPSTNVFPNLQPSPSESFPTTTAPPTEPAFGTGWNYSHLWDQSSNPMQPFGDMMIETQDVDMSMLGLDMLPWFDSYPTHPEFPPGLFDAGASNAADAGVGAQNTPQG